MRHVSTLPRALLACALFVTCHLPAARAQEARPAARASSAAEPLGDPGIERYLNIRSATSPALSPAADTVAFLLNVTGTPQVWSVPAAGGWPEQLTFYADRVDFVEWSPDGAGILFGKAVGGNENAQLYWLSPDGARVRALTNATCVRHTLGV